ncbi:MAG: permease-like cell division protein FtsX [Calditerrivibrio sp.]|nr:permease-like cell division protein FtsX [Calditerrivibrio sp.]MCA1980524.1 permease-like cell division protein FtsX [Calditerrivibrio sp.]
MTQKNLNLYKLLFLIRRGLTLFKRNIAINITSIITIITALYIFFIFFILSYSTDNFFGKLVNIQNIRAYVNTEDKGKIDSFIKYMKKLQIVKDVKFFSSEDSHKSLKESYMGEDYLNRLPKEFFPSFVEITLKDEFRDIKSVKSLEVEISKFDIIDVTSYGEKWLLNFLSVKVGLKIFLIALTFLLSLSIGSVIYNTINLNLFKFKNEIKIYSLVGATRTFIAAPYIFSSIIEVTLSFIIGFILQFVTFEFIKYFFLDKLGVIFITYPSFFICLMIYLVIILISAISSILSIYTFMDKMGAIGE